MMRKFKCFYRCFKMDKQTQKILIIGAGAIALIYVMRSGITDLFSSVTERLNLTESATEKQSAEQYSQIPTTNPFNPQYWVELQKSSYPKKIYFVTANNSEKIITDIYDSIHVYLPIAPDSDKILGIFSQLKYKSQISWIADKFQKKYNRDLLTFLDNGAPFFIGNTGLSDQSMRKLLTYVNSLPTGVVK